MDSQIRLGAIRKDVCRNGRRRIRHDFYSAVVPTWHYSSRFRITARPFVGLVCIMVVCVHLFRDFLPIYHKRRQKTQI